MVPDPTRVAPLIPNQPQPHGRCKMLPQKEAGNLLEDRLLQLSWPILGNVKREIVSVPPPASRELMIKPNPTQPPNLKLMTASKLTVMTQPLVEFGKWNIHVHALSQVGKTHYRTQHCVFTICSGLNEEKPEANKCQRKYQRGRVCCLDRKAYL